MSYFHDMISIVYNYFISHNITLQIILHNVIKKTKQTEWDGEFQGRYQGGGGPGDQPTS